MKSYGKVDTRKRHTVDTGESDNKKSAEILKLDDDQNILDYHKFRKNVHISLDEDPKLNIKTMEKLDENSNKSHDSLPENNNLRKTQKK